ncbi:HIT family protein [Haloquadratum walsbyi]|jgi:Diadenosine tetraphosphate (Ap4A) hydrolase and other HIT family hydrolases|uniref:Diadenosine tetraphosphate (Ap4A) hydrolase and other HIT family hydrolase n=1 Tax=Haloquadratum walsbyi J07HQW2 TaxID=1238425 RepID=U1MZ82_9EURY|nr:HIT family protein [Haloquadratum walsbyi]ERG95829.1 MAG: Diadenosine tetraphosphate (Ap4A) hydrolase and other HIT family hydrolase [Haloquadratum walsbyi J07HQW2]
MSEDSTIFEQIAAGEIPARIVHETETILAFLDANPLAPGHTLIIPKEAYTKIGDLPDDVAAELWASAQSLTPTIETAVSADATTVGINNGSAAGQEVPHVHIHIIPRFDDDGGGPIHAVAGTRPELSDSELDDIAANIESADNI